MSTVFKKMNYKGQSPVYIINAPESFTNEIDAIGTAALVKRSIAKAQDVLFILAFVTKQKEVDDLAKAIAPLVSGDGLVWFAYPKGTSKKYKCEFNRDSGWQEMGNFGFEPVRMVAIDEDWSALRFRKAEHTKSMSRSFAISDTGKKKVLAARKRKKE
jgi:hypothetical protein